MRGIPSPFIKIYERGRDTPHPSLCPLLPRKDLFAGLLARRLQRGAGELSACSCSPNLTCPYPYRARLSTMVSLSAPGSAKVAGGYRLTSIGQ